jgi:N-acetylmuramoyl-L-alanine amidase
MRGLEFLPEWLLLKQKLRPGTLPAVPLLHSPQALTASEPAIIVSAPTPVILSEDRGPRRAFLGSLGWKAKDLRFVHRPANARHEATPAALPRAAAFCAALALTHAAFGQQPAQQPAAPPFTVLLDAAHGGSETGARLNDHWAEKDFVLALSVRLRSLLTAHGAAVATTRESDANPSPDSRAAVANRTHAAACLILHATTSGTGVHLYTAALSPQPAPAGLTPWATAQAPLLTQSLKLSSDISTALGHAGIPVIMGQVSLAPVDNMACPAVILEVAPLLPRRGNSGAALDDPNYQTQLIDAIVGALEQWRADWKAQP